MSSKSNLENGLAKFQRQFSAGEQLYQQGAMSNTMFIILSGSVQLIRNTRGVAHLIGTVGAGEVLGEKALIKKTAYRHSLSASAATQTEALEFTAADFQMIQSRIPDFALKVIRVLSDRLDEANELVAILQSGREIERVVDYLLFFSKYHATKVPQGLEMKLSSTDIKHAINMDEDRVKELLSQLVQTRALIQKGDNYIIADTTLLEQQISEMREAA